MRGTIWRVALAAVALAAAGVLGWFMLLRPIDVTVVAVHRGPAIEAVYATGVVEAIKAARIGTTVAGRIDMLSVDEGASVHAGDVLAQLDDRQARQHVADAKARLATAEEELARGRELAQRGIRSQQQLQRDVELRDTTLASVQLFTRQLEEYRIVAPFDGVVMKRPVDPGETVAANVVLFEIAAPGALRVAADVDERDIPQVRMGARVAIRAEAFPGAATTAVLTNIRRQGESATRTFRVEADLAEDSKLMIGMTVDVNIVTAERADALLVPPGAISYGPAQGGHPGPASVFRVKDGHTVSTAVELGAVGTDSVGVRKGLEAYAEVIAPFPRV